MSKTIENITIGADPELFLRNITTGQIEPAFNYFEGNKVRPVPIPSLGAGYSWQCDNIMLEFNIPPAKTARGFTHSIMLVLKEIRKACAVYSNIDIIPAVSVHIDEGLSLHEKANEFGCDPDFNAWTGTQNSFDADAPKTLRCAGGHVHIGYNNASKEVSEALVKMLDLYLGIPSILLDRDAERRKLYGKAGAYRLTSYGVEYRVLSNFWIHKDTLMAWVCDGIMAAIRAINNGYIISDALGKDIVTAINTQNKDLALELRDMYIELETASHTKVITKLTKL